MAHPDNFRFAISATFTAEPVERFLTVLGTLVFEKLATIQMVDVWIPMLDNRWIVLPRYTQPEKDVQMLLEEIRITLSSQPPPRIKSTTTTFDHANAVRPGRFCGEDLLDTSTDSEPLILLDPTELRKTG